MASPEFIGILRREDAVFLYILDGPFFLRSIFPEKDYVNEGVGIFMGGFEHISKYYYSKTGKKITFYPMFISQHNRKMYICDPVTYNPENDPKVEKNNTLTYLRESMVSAYEKYEVRKEKYIKN